MKQSSIPGTSIMPNKISSRLGNRWHRWQLIQVIMFSTEFWCQWEKLQNVELKICNSVKEHHIQLARYQLYPMLIYCTVTVSCYSLTCNPLLVSSALLWLDTSPAPPLHQLHWLLWHTLQSTCTDGELSSAGVVIISCSPWHCLAEWAAQGLSWEAG